MREYTFSEEARAWLTGTQNDGIGIYMDGTEFFGNVVVEGDVTIGYGPYPSFETARADLEKEYDLEVKKRQESFSSLGDI